MAVLSWVYSNVERPPMVIETALPGGYTVALLDQSGRCVARKYYPKHPPSVVRIRKVAADWPALAVGYVMWQGTERVATGTFTPVRLLAGDSLEVHL